MKRALPVIGTLFIIVVCLTVVNSFNEVKTSTTQTSTPVPGLSAALAETGTNQTSTTNNVPEGMKRIQFHSGVTLKK